MLVWIKNIVILVKVKAREKETSEIKKWIRNRITDAINQLSKNYCRIINKEKIKLKNDFYHLFLDNDRVDSITGLIILDFDESCLLNPSELVPDIYKRDFPIHVISWNDIKLILSEIDTIPDLIYYLADRKQYLNDYDIPLCREMEAIGLYKSKLNKFPAGPCDFIKSNYWHEYRNKMKSSIKARDSHNIFSAWMDLLEDFFSQPRKLFDSIPKGLLFAWELGTLDRRIRANFGEKIEKVQEHFMKGFKTRRFAFQNPVTSNWLVFYFSMSEKYLLNIELKREVEFKLIIEIEEHSFDFGVYGFGFQVANRPPYEFLGLKSAIVIGADVKKGVYNHSDLNEAYKHFGGEKNYVKKKIEEFPK